MTDGNENINLAERQNKIILNTMYGEGQRRLGQDDVYIALSVMGEGALKMVSFHY